MLKEIESLLRAIVPDLAGVPLYIIDAGDLPDREQHMPNSARGLHGVTLDLALKSWLLSVGRWEGRGVAILVDSALVRFDAELTAEPGEDVEQTTRETMLALVLHEIAHAVERPFDLHEPDGYLECEAQQEKAEAVSAFASALLDNVPDDVPAWIGHTLSFFRMAIHLHHRAARAGHLVPLNYVVGGPYETSSIGCYAAAMGAEPADCAELTFAQIREKTPQQAAVDLWTADVRGWFMAKASPSTRTANAVNYELTKYLQTRSPK